MTSMNLRAPFSVQIIGNQLVVTQTVDGAKQVFCTLYLDNEASFFLRGDKVVYLSRFGKSFTFETDTSEDAHELLNQLAEAQLQRANVPFVEHSRHVAELANAHSQLIELRSQHFDDLAEVRAQHENDLDDALARHAFELNELRSRHAEQLAAAQSHPSESEGIPLKSLLALTGVAFAFLGVFLGMWIGPAKQPATSAVTGLPAARPLHHVSQPSNPNITPLPVLSAPTVAARPTEPAPSPTASSEVPDDGWALPQAIRATLPSKLHNAAERKLFTVDYSSGHARTLYVFADPSCPNCKHLEPALNALSDAFNVVVFPVPVIGKEKSIAAITPVLCLPPEQRKAAWDALFDSAPEGLSLGKAPEESEKQASEGASSKTAQPGECEVAVKALGINQMAYLTYHIPGTPWVISDDGRYVSQALLRDPLKLHAFLDEQPAHKAPEVLDASQ